MKFTIRDLFLVTLIVAVLLGWWVHSSRLREEIFQLEFRERLRYPDHTPPGLRSPLPPARDIPDKEPVD
jgi:hypothetical protein